MIKVFAVSIILREIKFSLFYCLLFMMTIKFVICVLRNQQNLCAKPYTERFEEKWQTKIQEAILF